MQKKQVDLTVEDLNKLKKSELISLLIKIRDDIAEAMEQIELANQLAMESREIVEYSNIAISRVRPVIIVACMISATMGYIVGMTVEAFIK